MTTLKYSRKLTHLTVLFFLPFGILSFCFCITTGKNIINGSTDFTCELKAMHEAVFFNTLTSAQISCLSLTYCFINLTSQTKRICTKIDDLARSERPETKMAALGRDGERLDPRTRVLAVLARISERGCQTLFIRSIKTKNVVLAEQRTRTRDIFPSTSICNSFFYGVFIFKIIKDWPKR